MVGCLKTTFMWQLVLKNSKKKIFKLEMYSTQMSLTLLYNSLIYVGSTNIQHDTGGMFDWALFDN